MEKDLEQRTKRFALAVLEFASSLPGNRAADVLVRQLLRSATSIGANYREANRGVSRADFANKIGTVQKKAAETQYWIELLMESGDQQDGLRRKLAQGIHRTPGDLHLDREAPEKVVRTVISYFLISLSTFSDDSLLL
jgi:four helix bundle protein